MAPKLKLDCQLRAPSFVEAAGKTADEIQPSTGKANDLLRFLRKKPKATIPEMSTELGLTEDGINYHLKKLQMAGKLQRTGGRKKGHWRVIE